MNWTERVTADRLAAWAKDLEHEHSTPLLMIGIGHGNSSGRIVICTVEDAGISNKVLAGFLRYAIKELGEQP